VHALALFAQNVRKMVVSMRVPKPQIEYMFAMCSSLKADSVQAHFAGTCRHHRR
jgi:hypothetical protein